MPARDNEAVRRSLQPSGRIDSERVNCKRERNRSFCTRRDCRYNSVLSNQGFATSDGSAAGRYTDPSIFRRRSSSTQPNRHYSLRRELLGSRPAAAPLDQCDPIIDILPADGLEDVRVCKSSAAHSRPPHMKLAQASGTSYVYRCLSFYDFRPFAILRIAARLPSTSSSVVAQLETLIRIAVRPCH